MARRSTRLLAVVLAGTAVSLLLGGGCSPASAEVRSICFPVLDSPVHYTRDFGAPRSGHVHEGTDIIGQKMFRLDSPVDGVVVDVRYAGDGSNADNGVRIRADDGYYYVFLHMNNDTPGTDDGRAPMAQVFAPAIATGARVQAGQFVGYMGDSGNAEDAGAHLHFEVRLPAARVWDAVAIDGYDSLQAARRCAPVNSPTHPFTGLGGVLTADPDIASTGVGLLDVVARGTDGAVWSRAWNGAQFTAWTTQGGIIRGGPSSAAPAPDRLDLFARGQDDGLWQNTRLGGTWGGWVPLGGTLTSDPDAGTCGHGDLVVAVRGTDGAPWLRQFDGTTWGPWTSAGGSVQSAPTVAVTSPGTFELFARGLDDALWHRPDDPAGWGGWASAGGVINADPDAAVEGGEVAVVVRGADGTLLCLPFTAGGGWEQVSTNAVGGGAGVVSWGPGRLDAVVASTDGGLYQTWWSSDSGW